MTDLKITINVRILENEDLTLPALANDIYTSLKKLFLLSTDQFLNLTISSRKMVKVNEEFTLDQKDIGK